VLRPTVSSGCGDPNRGSRKRNGVRLTVVNGGTEESGKRQGIGPEGGALTEGKEKKTRRRGVRKGVH